MVRKKGKQGPSDPQPLAVSLGFRSSAGSWSWSLEIHHDGL
jgi:hypothetical protein